MNNKNTVAGVIWMFLAAIYYLSMEFDKLAEIPAGKWDSWYFIFLFVLSTFYFYKGTDGGWGK